jgi:hypothetical protein
MATLSAVQSSCASESLNPLDRAIQRELAALATIEADHCSACRWLDEWSGPTEVKEHLARRLEARHRTEREAHVLRLADLHQKRVVLVIAETLEHTDEVSGGSGAGLSPSKLPKLLPSVWMTGAALEGGLTRAHSRWFPIRSTNLPWAALLRSDPAGDREKHYSAPG